MKTRAKVEHVFGFMTCGMSRLYESVIGARRAAGSIGQINLVYNLCRYKQIKRLGIKFAPAKPAAPAPAATPSAAEMCSATT